MIFRHHAILILAAQCATAFITPNTASTRLQVQSASNFAFVPKHNVRLFSDVADATEDAAPAEAEVEVPVAKEATEEEAAPAEETAEEEAEEPKETFTIYVGNLSYEMTESEIKELFEEHGAVSKVTVPQNKYGEGSRGFAFVEMASKEDLEKACEALDQTEIAGRTVYVSESVPREKGERRKPVRNKVEGMKLYVGNLSFDTTGEVLRDYFGQFGNVIDVYIPYDQTRGMSRGYAFVTLGKEDAEKAIEGANGQELEGRTLTVNESLPRGQKAPPRKPRVEGTKLYVGNLSFDTAEEDLRYLFEEFGDIIDCYMPKDRETGRSRGFAFVTMDNEATMRAADETDGCEMDGRILRVNEAQPKGSSYSGGGGGYGYNYDDGANDGDSWGDDGDDSWGNESY